MTAVDLGQRSRLAQQHDEQLVEAAARGDAAAWAELVDRYVELLWRMAERLVGAEQAEAVSELVWLRLATRLPELPGVTRVRLWLLQAVWDDCARRHVAWGVPTLMLPPAEEPLP
jgi:DNA-directed RNA polymerase specialized sigma24 family protein